MSAHEHRIVFCPTEIKIIEAFLDLAERQGVQSITLQKVADEADVAFGTVRYHFADPKRPDLAQAAILHVYQTAQRFIEDFLFEERAKAKYNGVEAYVLGMFAWMKEYRKHSAMHLYYYYLCATEIPLAVSNRAYLETARTRIAALLYEAAGRGLIPQRKDAEALALKIHAILVGGLFVAISERTADAYRVQSRIVLEAVRTMLKN